MESLKKSFVVQATDKVPISGKIGYMCSGLSTFFTEILATFVMYFATQNLTIAIGSISLMIVLAKIFDGITDILCGVIIDKLNSKHGKARPWFLRMAVPYPLCMALIFFIPDSWGPVTQIVVLAILYTLTVSVFGTIVGVARIALLSRMTNNGREQGVLATLSGGAAAVFAGAAMSIAVPLGTKIGYSWTFTIFSAFACVMCLLTYLLTKESVDEISTVLETERVKKHTVRNLVKTVLSNKYAFLCFIYQMLLIMASGFMSACGLYYSQYVMGDVNLFSKVMAYNILSSIAGVVICVPLVKKVGSRVMFIICLIEPIISYLVLLAFNGTSTMVFVIVIVVNGLFLAIAPAQTIAISARAVDYGEWKTGDRTEGIISSLLNLGLKIGSALSTAIIGGIMAACGFVSGAEIQSQHTVNSIAFSFSAMPVIVYGILLVLFIFTYKIDKQYDKKLT